MPRANLYCEVEFFKKFFRHLPIEFSFDDEKRKKHILWFEYYDLITKSNIHLNISYPELDMLTKESEDESHQTFFKYLWKKHTAGECKLDCESTEFIENDDLSDSYKNNAVVNGSIFLLACPKGICEKLSSQYGLLAFCDDSLFSSDIFFTNYIKNVKKDLFHLSFWKFLKELHHPCNALTIIDNYILQDGQSIKNNLIPILKYLLPEKLNIPFHISIFTLKEPNGRILDFASKKNEIEKELKKIKPNLNIQLCLIALQNKSHHDRSLITNYIQIDSGSGFDIIGNNNKSRYKTTLIAYFPKSNHSISDASDDSNLELISSLKKITDNAVSNENIKTYWGEKANRLFDYN